jgi:hypothetical protein
MALTPYIADNILIRGYESRKKQPSVPCPYLAGTECASRWRKGWQLADEEIEREDKPVTEEDKTMWNLSKTNARHINEMRATLKNLDAHIKFTRVRQDALRDRVVQIMEQMAHITQRMDSDTGPRPVLPALCDVDTLSTGDLFRYWRVDGSMGNTYIKMITPAGEEATRCCDIRTGYIQRFKVGTMVEKLEGHLAVQED